MNKVIIIVAISIFAFAPFAGLAQSGRITAQISLIDSSSNNSSQFIFRVVVKNNSKGALLVQNSDYIKSLVSAPVRNYIYPFLEIEDSGKFRRYEPNSVHYSFFEDTCLSNCCKCFILGKGKTANIDLKILECYTLRPGRYKLDIGMRFPFDNLENNKDVKEIFSNYIYFNVGK